MKLLKYSSLTFLLLLILVPLFHYPGLPDEIPQHFNFYGKPDIYGEKSIIWILPIVGIGMFVGLNIVARIPDRHNYLVSISKENAERQYRNSRQLIMVTLNLILLSFLYITWGVIQTAKGNWEGLGKYFLLAFLTVQLGVMGFFLWRSFKLK